MNTPPPLPDNQPSPVRPAEWELLPGRESSHGTFGPFAERRFEPAPKARGIWGSLVALLLFFGKYLKVILSSGKFLVFGKMFLSMAVSLGAYAMMNGWAFAAVFIALLMIHEMGHVWAAKRIGLPVSAPLFIPFLGAAISMKRNPQSAAHEAYVAVGGPILGTMGALLALSWGWASGSAFMSHMAAVGFFLNLFNLVPVSPLDGGRIVASVSPWLWLVGALILVSLLIWMNAWMFLIIIVFVAGPKIRSLFQDRDEQWEVYHRCTKRQRIYASAAWLGLALLLGFSMLLSGLGAQFPRHEALGVGLAIAWAVFAVVGGVSFFTWPLEERV